MSTTAANRARPVSGRDAVVTGMGFCLPGDDMPVFTAGQLWDVAAQGRSCLRRDEVFYGSVDLAAETFEQLVPYVPGHFSEHFTDAHRFGLLSLTVACEDAGLDLAAGALADAAVLAGRGGVDTNVGNYLAILDADPDKVGPQEAMGLFVRGQQGITPSDVALVQSAVIRSSGPCFTVSCGCASSAVQIGNARRMIACGEIDIAVVTGVDLFSVEVIQNVQNLLRGVQRAYEAMRVDGMPELLPSFDRLMRPYDRRAECVNHGEGSAWSSHGFRRTFAMQGGCRICSGTFDLGVTGAGGTIRQRHALRRSGCGRVLDHVCKPSQPPGS